MGLIPILLFVISAIAIWLGWVVACISLKIDEAFFFFCLGIGWCVTFLFYLGRISIAWG